MPEEKYKMKKVMPMGDSSPQLRLTSDQYSEIKDWKVGEKYTLEVEIEAKSKHEGQEYTFDTANKGLTRMTFDVLSIKEK